MTKPVRYLVVFLVWPWAYLSDRLTGADRPASLRRGLDWARDGKHSPTVRTADKPAVVRGREKP